MSTAIQYPTMGNKLLAQLLCAGIKKMINVALDGEMLYNLEKIAIQVIVFYHFIFLTCRYKWGLKDTME